MSVVLVVRACTVLPIKLNTEHFQPCANAHGGSFLLQTIKAMSPLGDPRVTYNLEEGQVPETNMPIRFYLRPNRADGSASLLVAEPLDFETTKFFSLVVRAQNVAMTPLASFTIVYVNVTGKHCCCLNSSFRTLFSLFLL